MTEYFKRDPSGTPVEVTNHLLRKLMATKEARDALRHGDMDSRDDIGGYSDLPGGDRRGAVVGTIAKLFAELEAT